MNLKDFIVPTKLYNTNIDGKIDKSLKTEDLIYLDSASVVGHMSENEIITYPTDYAIMNGAVTLIAEYSSLNRQSSWTWLRSSYTLHTAYMIDYDGGLSDDYVDNYRCTLCPALHLNLSSVISAQSASNEVFKVNTVKNSKGKELYHTIEFGEYPKTYVGEKLNKQLERMYKTNIITETGKNYTGRLDDSGKLISHTEFEYVGRKYVRVLTKNYDDNSEYSDGTMVPEDGTYVWVKVEPIVWKIRNWNELPKEINPNGTGKAEYIDVKTEEGIATLPFYPNNHDENCSMWQNSTIRGYLNGINVNNIKTNGNTKFTASNGGDFTKQNLLTEALDIELELQETKVHATQKTTRKTPAKGYGVTIQSTPMTVAEQINFYINTGKSFMLHGPSGVGKTRRIEEADPKFVSIVLRNGILPEEVIGKTIYPNNDTTKQGKWVPPAWYVQLCALCEKEPSKNHVLFIDEITNVKPSEQSLVFHLVLNNSIGPNVGKLPDNVVVVAAGNNKEESEAAYNMPEPLFRRFDGHIELKPDIQQFIEWGSEPSTKRKGQPKIHPLVSNFVATYGKNVFYSPYDSEEPPKYAIDPRGWEQISNIIYDNNGVIAKELIQNKVGKEITTTFIAFAKKPQLTLEDILTDNYEQSEIPTKIDAKYALAVSLRNASETELPKVREFIYNNLGNEITSMFDTLWVGDDNEKAMLVEELRQKQPKIKNTPKQKAPTEPKGNYKITVDEFVKQYKNNGLLSGIFCNAEWKAKLLLEVFARMKFKIETEKIPFIARVYLNNGKSCVKGAFDHVYKNKVVLYNFKEVDLTKYLTPAELNKLTEKLEQDIFKSL